MIDPRFLPVSWYSWFGTVLSFMFGSRELYRYINAGYNSSIPIKVNVFEFRLPYHWRVLLWSAWTPYDGFTCHIFSSESFAYCSLYMSARPPSTLITFSLEYKMFPPKHLQRIRLTKSVEISMNSPLSVYNLLLRQMKLYVLCDCHDGNASTMVHSMKVLVTVAKRECHVLVELVVVKMVLLKKSLKAPSLHRF